MRIGFTRLDLKLAGRMLVKYPGLSLVAGISIAFAVAIGAVFFELFTQALHPTLPLPDGDRIVGLRNWDVSRNRAEPHVAHDLARWRELPSLDSLAAFRSTERNLIVGDASAPLSLAEMSASGFRVARVPPLLGRPLLDAD